MKSIRVLFAIALLGLVAGLAYVAQQGAGAGVKMAAAAQGFLGKLTDEQKAKAVFPFDSKERSRWFFVPLQDKKTRMYTRKGLPLEEMTDEQKKAARALVAASTSADGNIKALTIMSLEAILRDQEKGGAMVRNPEWYFFTIFGTPGKEKWGWRVEGHHLSLNFTMEGDRVLASTPTFFGANPAEIKSGPKKGFRTLASAEDLAIKLFASLDADQRKLAFEKEQFKDPKQATIVPNLGQPKGLAAAKMNNEQVSLLRDLLRAYTSRLPEEIARIELKNALEPGIGKIHFAYAGGTKTGQPHSYRVHGPTFVIEFLNVQKDSAGNSANHIHSAWRRIKGDFGL